MHGSTRSVCVHHVFPLDVHSPGILLAGRTQTLVKDSKEAIREAAAKGLRERWDLEAHADASAPIFDAWFADVEARLVPVPKARVEFFHIDDAIAAGRAQVKAVKEILSSLPLDEAARNKVRSEQGLLVPRVVVKS